MRSGGVRWQTCWSLQLQSCEQVNQGKKKGKSIHTKHLGQHVPIKWQGRRDSISTNFNHRDQLLSFTRQIKQQAMQHKNFYHGSCTRVLHFDNHVTQQHFLLLGHFLTLSKYVVDYILDFFNLRYLSNTSNTIVEKCVRKLNCIKLW